MAYAHRASSADSKSELVTSESFANRPYTEQVWYTEPMKGWTGWTDPLKGSDTEDEPLVTFCLPLRDKSGERVGVIATDVSINQLSKIILAAKPSENGYSILLADNGSYIVHPDKEKLTASKVFSHKNRNVDTSEMEAAKAMIAGEKGMKEFRRNNCDWFVFFKPLERVGWEGWSKGATKWSVGVVCPENDIFDKHNVIIYQVLAIAIAGILLFLLLCNWIIRRQLKPLRELAESAQHIAEGNYHEMLPYTERLDEIGLLQKQFEQMQHSLRAKVAEQEEETVRLHQHGGMLRAAYDKTLGNDAMKSYYSLGGLIVALLVIGLLGIVLLCYQAVKQLVNPINQLIDTTQKIADEIKFLNEKLNNTKLQTEDIVRRKSLFIQQMTQQMRMPLNVIDMNRMLLLLYDATETDATGALSRHRVDEVSCNKLSRECISHTHNHFPETDIRFEPELQDTFCLLTNRFYLMGILRELLYNAVRYSYGKDVVLSLTQTDTTIRFTVQDFGPRLLANLPELTFKPFTMPEAGIGLSLVRRHAIALGGSMIIDTDYHEGCRIMIEMPK